MTAVAVVSIYGTALPYERSLEVVFYSWWFRSLLSMLVVNLALCTYQTLATRVLPAFRPRIPKSPDHYEEGPLRYVVESWQDPGRVAAILRGRGYRVTRDGDYLCARRGLLRLFAAPAAHSGFLLVLLAGFASGFIAFNGQVRLIEGESTTVMQMSGRQPSERPLNFEVRCLDFETGTFPQTEIPSRFVSTLEVRDGEKRFVEIVEVNRALKYRGLKFHQSGFGQVPEKLRYRLSVTDPVASRTTQMAATTDLPAPIADWGLDLVLRRSTAGLRYTVSDDQGTVTSGSLGPDTSALQLMAMRFVPDFMIGPDRQVESRSEEMNNPALQVVWLQDGKPLSRQWLFLKPELRQFSHAEQEGTRLELENAAPNAEGKIQFGLAAYDTASKALLGRFTMTLGQVVRLSDVGVGTSDSACCSTTSTAEVAADSKRFDIQVVGTEPLYYTDLAVSYNPMIAVIYLGAILSSLGICFALYLRRTTLWVWCQAENGRLRLAVQYSPERFTLTAHAEKTIEALK